MTPAFLVTIDTEGDDLWSRPREITTRNAAFLPRFQEVCEQFGFKPTWLTNYEMATDAAYVEFARDVLRRGTGEVGLHLHAWNSPPIEPLTDDDFRWQPFLIEYPDRLIREKVHVLTSMLEETFGVPIRSHRAGRWAFDERYARVLIERGYTSDCSVTPSISWRRTKGNPAGQGGSDYTLFPEWPYFVDPDDISRPGRSALLEIPMTTRAPLAAIERRIPARLKRVPLVSRLLKRRLWFRPKPGNLAEMLRLVKRAVSQEWPYLMFMLHSSELMPGGSPNFKSAADIEGLFADLLGTFEAARQRFSGQTVTEFRRASGSERVAPRPS